MNNKLLRNGLGLALVFGLMAQTFAHSPYENLIAEQKVKHVGLAAAAQTGKGADLDKALKALCQKGETKALKKQGITNASFYKKLLPDGRTWYVVYFDYKGENYLKAAESFEKAAPELAVLVDSHPRAKVHGAAWLQMEWVCFIRGVMDESLPTQSASCLVTRIKPEKEELYRTLHQTVWPGVIDQLARSNNRNVSVFFMELGDELFEFLYLEYVGHDAAADGASSKVDPCTLRWWALTDDCQDPLPEVKDGGIWAGMERIEAVAK